MVGKNQLREWFSNGKKPTQEQFWQWQDSYYHKEESISKENVIGLNESLNKKADSALVDAHMQDEDAHGLSRKADIIYVEQEVSRLEKDSKDKLDIEEHHAHLQDSNAHGIEYLCSDINFNNVFEEELNQ